MKVGARRRGAERGCHGEIAHRVRAHIRPVAVPVAFRLGAVCAAVDGFMTALKMARGRAAVRVAVRELGVRLAVDSGVIPNTKSRFWLEEKFNLS